MISTAVVVNEETSIFFGRSKISFLYVCKKIAMPEMHPLKVIEVQRLTDDAVAYFVCCTKRSYRTFFIPIWTIPHFITNN